jgi:hypothetical protein
MSAPIVDHNTVQKLRGIIGSWFSHNVLELIQFDAKKAFEDGKYHSLEDAIIEKARGVWIAAHTNNRAVDFEQYVLDQLAKGDSLLSRLFKRKSKLDADAADHQAITDELFQLRGLVPVTDLKIQGLEAKIAKAESDLAHYKPETIEAAIEQAARAYDGKTAHEESLYQNAVAHAVSRGSRQGFARAYRLAERSIDRREQREGFTSSPAQ